MSTVTWHHGPGRENWDFPSEPGEWHAKADGEVIARAEVREGTRPGYWGHYQYVMLGSGRGRLYATTLSEIKTAVQRWHDGKNS